MASLRCFNASGYFVGARSRADWLSYNVAMFSSVRLPTLAVPLLALALASCGSSSPQAARVKNTASTLPAVANQITGYVASGTGFAMYLQFTKTGSQFSGTLQEAELNSQGTGVKTSSNSVTGDISGANITLKTGLSFAQTSFSGTISASVISLNFADQSGQLVPVEFSPSTVAAYDALVAKLQSDAQATQASDQAAAAAQQQAAAAKQQLDNNTASAAQNVGSDEGNISGGSSNLQGDESALAVDVSNVKSDLNNLYGELQQTQSDLSSNPSLVCGDASLVQGDLSIMKGDQSNFQDDVSVYQSDVKQVQQGLSALPGDWTALMAAEQGDPGYAPLFGLPSQSGEQAALQAGPTAISQFNATVSSDQQTINGLLGQGQTYLNDANSLCTQAG